MAIFFGETERDKAAFRVRAHRGQLKQLYRGVYTDDFDQPTEAIVRENILAIAAGLLPGWQVSHSSAAVRGVVGNKLFVSGPGKTGRHLELPGVQVVRLPELRAPEFDRIATTPEVHRGVDRPPETLFIRVSTPLQTIFECLSTARRYPEKNLTDVQLADLIARLAPADRERAERFAARNGLRREYLRFQELSFGIAESRETRIPEPDGADIYFYGWRIGRLTYLGSGDYRFGYDDKWPVPLSAELPMVSGRSYEGRRMPAFFENCLPEGWTESVVLASNKLAQEDLFGLLTTTRKYLSNLTLRPLGIPEAELVYDAHDLRLAALVGKQGSTLRMREEIGAEPGDPSLWRRTRSAGPLRLSGVQAKLPVSMTAGEHGELLRIGGLRQSCTHILKVPSLEHRGLIENEWATMELARRIGLPVAPVAMVEFQVDSVYRGRSLLVERYDIPERTVLEAGSSNTSLVLQEDACSLLLLRRDEKYQPSHERIADALLAAGIPADHTTGSIYDYGRLVLFSWIVGNGDLHAKNVSIVRQFRSGRPGEPPVFERTALAPFYDLVNTRLHIPNDEFALPVDGRRNKLRLKNFVALARRWHMVADAMHDYAAQIALGLNQHLESVLAESTLPRDLADRYRKVVHENLAGLGL